MNNSSNEEILLIVSLVCTYVFSHRLSTPKIVLFLETERGQITILKKYTPDFSLPYMPIKCFIPPRYGIYCGSFQWPLRGGQAEGLEARQTVWRPIRGSERPARGSGGQSECLGGQLMGWGGHPETGRPARGSGRPARGSERPAKGPGGPARQPGRRVGQRPLWYWVPMVPSWAVAPMVPHWDSDFAASRWRRSNREPG